MKNVMLWIGVIMTIAGSIFAALTDVANDIPGIAVAAFGLAVTIMAVWKKSEKKDWKVILSIVLIAIGAFLLGFAGMAESVMTQLIAGVIAIVMLIAGILVVTIKKSTTTDPVKTEEGQAK